MATLTIDFQDGFKDDTIYVKVDGNVLFQKEHVGSSPLIGIADSIKYELETDHANIEVNIPTKDLRMVISLDISSDKYLGISIIDGKIDKIISSEPFGYG